MPRCKIAGPSPQSPPHVLWGDARLTRGAWPCILSRLSAASRQLTSSMVSKNNFPPTPPVLSANRGLYLEMWRGMEGLAGAGNRPAYWGEAWTVQLFPGGVKRALQNQLLSGGPHPRHVLSADFRSGLLLIDHFCLVMTHHRRRWRTEAIMFIEH